MAKVFDNETLNDIRRAQAVVSAQQDTEYFEAHRYMATIDQLQAENARLEEALRTITKAEVMHFRHEEDAGKGIFDAENNVQYYTATGLKSIAQAALEGSND